jgi:hypothetical protein
MSAILHEDVLSVHNAALSIGLASSREALLSGLDAHLVAGLVVCGSPREQLLLDLNALNDAETCEPLTKWLNNAVGLAPGGEAATVFEAALLKLSPRLGSPSSTRTRRPPRRQAPDLVPLRQQLVLALRDRLDGTFVAARISFWVRLEGWDPQTRSWRCPALRIPAATLGAIYRGRNRVDQQHYFVDRTRIRAEASFLSPTSTDLMAEIWISDGLDSVLNLSAGNEGVEVMNCFPTEEFRRKLTHTKQVRILQTFIPIHVHLRLFENELIKAIQNGCAAEVLLCDPWSQVVRFRQNSLESVSASDVKHEVEQNLRQFAAIRSRLTEDARARLNVRVYSTLPSMSIYQQDTTFICGNYFHGRLAIDGPQFKVTNQNPVLGELLEREHRKIWQHKHTRPVRLSDVDGWLREGPVSTLF